MKNKVLILSSIEDTMAFARECALSAVKGSCFALYGDLGAGKTLFTKAFAKALGVADDVTSPTYTLCEEYEGRLKLYHFDLYRIEKSTELDMLYFEEYWEGDGVSVIEWAERAGSRIPERSVKIYLTYIDENTRRAEIEYPAD